MNVTHYLARVQIAPSSKETYKVCLLKLERWLDRKGVAFEDMTWDNFIEFVQGMKSNNTARLYHSATRSYATQMRINSEVLDKNNYIR